MPASSSSVGDAGAQLGEPGVVLCSAGVHDGVVLVGAQQALAAPARAEHQHAPGGRRLAAPLGGHARQRQLGGARRSAHAASCETTARDLAAAQAFRHQTPCDLRHLAVGRRQRRAGPAPTAGRRRAPWRRGRGDAAGRAATPCRSRRRARRPRRGDESRVGPCARARGRASRRPAWPPPAWSSRCATGVRSRSSAPRARLAQQVALGEDAFGRRIRRPDQQRADAALDPSARAGGAQRRLAGNEHRWRAHEVGQTPLEHVAVDARQPAASGAPAAPHRAPRASPPRAWRQHEVVALRREAAALRPACARPPRAAAASAARRPARPPGSRPARCGDRSIVTPRLAATVSRPRSGSAGCKRADQHRHVERRRLVPGEARARRLVAQHREVEADVVADDHAAREHVAQRRTDAREIRRAATSASSRPWMRVGDRRNRHAGIDQLVDARLVEDAQRRAWRWHRSAPPGRGARRARWSPGRAPATGSAASGGVARRWQRRLACVAGSAYLSSSPTR